MTDAERNLYRVALSTWGEKAQVFMAIEECGELLAALAQFERGRTSVEAVADEIADVLVMIEQMAVMIGEELVMRRKEQKLLRVRGLLALEAQEL